MVHAWWTSLTENFESSTITEAGGIAVLGLLLILAGLFADPSRGRKRCPKCWFSLQMHEPDECNRIVCPECGHQLTKSRHARKARRSWPRALMGMVLFAAAMFYPKIARDGPLSVIPLSVLAVTSPDIGHFWFERKFNNLSSDRTPDHWLIEEIERRQTANQLNAADRRALVGSLRSASQRRDYPMMLERWKSRHDSMAQLTIELDPDRMTLPQIREIDGLHVEVTNRLREPSGVLRTRHVRGTLSLHQALEDTLVIHGSTAFPPVRPSGSLTLKYPGPHVIRIAKNLDDDIRYPMVFDLRPIRDALLNEPGAELAGTPLQESTVSYWLQEVTDYAAGLSWAINYRQALIDDRWLVVKATSFTHHQYEQFLSEFEEGIRGGALVESEDDLRRHPCWNERPDNASTERDEPWRTGPYVFGIPRDRRFVFHSLRGLPNLESLENEDTFLMKARIPVDGARGTTWQRVLGAFVEPVAWSQSITGSRVIEDQSMALIHAPPPLQIRCVRFLDRVRRAQNDQWNDDDLEYTRQETMEDTRRHVTAFYDAERKLQQLQHLGGGQSALFAEIEDTLKLSSTEFVSLAIIGDFVILRATRPGHIIVQNLLNGATAPDTEGESP